MGNWDKMDEVVVSNRGKFLEGTGHWELRIVDFSETPQKLKAGFTQVLAEVEVISYRGDDSTIKSAVLAPDNFTSQQKGDVLVWRVDMSYPPGAGNVKGFVIPAIAGLKLINGQDPAVESKEVNKEIMTYVFGPDKPLVGVFLLADSRLGKTKAKQEDFTFVTWRLSERNRLLYVAPPATAESLIIR